MAKRKLQFVNYDNIQEELASANVHGVVTHVSPVKKSKTGKPYFHGQLSDGVNTLRFFGFAPNQQQVLKIFRINRTSLEMCNCQVKKSTRDSAQVEILVKGATKMKQSNKVYDMSAISFQEEQAIEITLSELNEIEPLTIITLSAKVINTEEPVTLGTKRKQAVQIADQTGTATINLWEENIGILSCGKSYHLVNFRVIEYESVKYISMCWEGSEVRQIPELKDVMPTETIEDPDIRILKNCKIAAVFKLESVYKCLRCSSRTEAGQDLSDARCCNPQCGILNNSTFCENLLSAELLFISLSSDEKVILTGFGQIVLELLGPGTSTDCSQVTEEALLHSQPISTLTYKHDQILRIKP